LKRGLAFAVMVTAFAIALPLMIVFDSPVTRVLGVLGLFTFIVAGVFAIADPAFLDEEPEGLD
jgi:NADH:ubiquinone oxidoreductase subunit 6 (subunit J)